MKKSRHSKIIEIIRHFDVGTQEELAQRLKAEGFSVTQATVSRDIRELQLSKMTTEGGGQKYVFPEQGGRMESKYIYVLREAYISCEAAQNILVLKTASGMAMAAAAALDALNFPEIVGSIAGDDTIFVAVHTSEEAGILSEKIRRKCVRNQDFQGAESI